MKNNFGSKSIFIIVLAFNMILLYLNILKQKTINELQNQVINYEKVENNNYLPFKIKYDLAELGKLETKDDKVFLVSLLKGDNCNKCLEDEIKFLNTINTKYGKYLKVYYQGHPNRLKASNAEFNFNVIDNLQEKFSLSIIIDNPVSLLVDNNGYIHSYHKAVVGDTSASGIFFSKVNSLFNLIYEK